MTKKEYIQYWVEAAKKDGDLADKIFASGDYVYTLFFCHLYLEKLCKALWVHTNAENVPPKTHNLMFLLNASNVALNESEETFFTEMNVWQLEGRCPDYQFGIYKLCTKQFTEPLLQQTKQYAKWLHSKMP